MWSGSGSNGECGAGYNASRWVCLWASSGCWCATTACNGRGGWSIYCPSLCSRKSENDALSDISNTRIVQRRWVGGVFTLDCRGYGTPSLRGIPPASYYGNASLSMGKLRIPQRPILMLILMICMTSNISYDRSCIMVRPLGWHSSKWMFDIENVGVISSVCICNGRRGTLLLEWPGRDSTKKGRCSIDHGKI